MSKKNFLFISKDNFFIKLFFGNLEYYIRNKSIDIGQISYVDIWFDFLIAYKDELQNLSKNHDCLFVPVYIKQDDLFLYEFHLVYYLNGEKHYLTFNSSSLIAFLKNSTIFKNVLLKNK